ncbi:hypothetical protein J5N97_005898 [Dioscorea zingiberensis]|uniref:Uncharacterized protein n=1 Tax=Dioscorea zingiberensis TaxID=325984 RepID=A0A9D5HTH2_9LILI|nr:hypothetical protein J5N97_005898 [Dioscorea zingiberensis]
MPGLLPRGSPPSCSSSGGIWSRQRDAITNDQLQKFWNELPPSARQELLRIDKQTLFEQARKNLYCSRCNGLLLEGYSQIIIHGKSLQQVGAVGAHFPNRVGTAKMQTVNGSDVIQDPSVHPWGGLTATRDGILTLLDCFLKTKSLKPLQNVFDSAKARERDREMLYPDACGGGGRGWISQGMANYGRGHGTRETCALHTTKLACKTLVDFWRALGDETRLSLLHMKEEDFIERLMYRFDSKRFCRDCRRNVIREFKELKELKRMRRELHCTSWFCLADTAFQYEVSEDTVQADWHQTFTDTIGTYHHFEWAVGTGEGKSDILDFEDVGMNENVHVNGLELGGLSSCFITLRAWKLDGRCTELFVKAHALKGQQCVHRRLVIGDGYVTITEGESIERFFEHAEEAEEEEDDDAIDKDGNEYDGDGSRPQKHAKSPELAREFLLDAATVIFKEQVEKAFREGTARQNAHCIFVCLALKLLEERLHVACKEVITLEKQIKLLEEEENEKREEEERKERRRTKQREKKNRRKERLKGKEREREGNCSEPSSLLFDPLASVNDSSTSTHDESVCNPDSGDSNSDPGDNVIIAGPAPDIVQEKTSNGLTNTDSLRDDNLQHKCHVDGELSARDSYGSFILEQSKSSRRKLRYNKDSVQDQSSKGYDKRQVVNGDRDIYNHESNISLLGCVVASSRCMNGMNKQPRVNGVKTNARSVLKFSEKFHCPNSRMRDRHDFHSCSCGPRVDYKAKDGYHMPVSRSSRESCSANKKDSSLDMSRAFYRSSKFNHGCYSPDNVAIPKGKLVTSTTNRDFIYTKQVWEPMDSRKKCMRSNSDPDINSKTASKLDQSLDDEISKEENEYQLHNSLDSANMHCSSELSEELDNGDVLNISPINQDRRKDSNGHISGNANDCQNGYVMNSSFCSKDGVEEVDTCPIISAFPLGNNDCDPIASSSSSGNCSSCLSEGDSSTSSSSGRNAESSSTSDSEDANPQCNEEDPACTFSNDASDRKINRGGSLTDRMTTEVAVASCNGAMFSKEDMRKADKCLDNGDFGYNMTHPSQNMLPMHNPAVHVSSFPSPTIGYHDQSAACWSGIPTNGFMPFHQPNHYMFSSPFGYGVAASQSSDFFIQYDRLHHLASPSYNIDRHPIYHPPSRSNAASLKEKTKNSEMHGTQKIEGVNFLVEGAHSMEKPFSDRQGSSKSASQHNDTVPNADKSHNDNGAFSLFHFGGPLAGVEGYCVNPALPKDEKTVGLPSSTYGVQADVACLKEEMEVEEYSLFATSNAARFSFF